MEQPVVAARKKGMIVRTGIGLIAALMLFTFLSKTINGMLMPKVYAATIARGQLHWEFEAEGTFKLQNKHKVFSAGTWRVKEAAVKPNQPVKKGDLLAVMENTDVLTGLKNKELEIVKLENAIERQKQDYEPVRLADFEREAQAAKEAVDFAEKKLDRMKELLELGAETRDNLENAEREYRDKLFIYESKLEDLADKGNDSIQEKEEFDRSMKEKVLELELKKAEYEKEKSSMPPDGRILSACDGIVSAINIEAGMTTSVNQVIAEIIDSNSSYRVIWYMDQAEAANYDIGFAINVSGKSRSVEDEAKAEDYSFSLDIGGKEYLPESNSVMLWADVQGDWIQEAGIVIMEGQKTRVAALKSSKNYDLVVPKSAMTEIDGQNCVFAISERKGALGVEKIIRKVSVGILETDDFSAAIEGYFDMKEQIVLNTTKPLVDGIQVQVR